MPSPIDRVRLLKEALAERILVLDGATGTALQRADLSAADFGGPELEGCNENLNLTRPDVIRRLHEEYFRAGADIVETNTFGATDIVLAEYGLEGQVSRINSAAGRLARQAAEALSTPARPRFVAGAMGPSTKSISVTGGITYERLIDAYRWQARSMSEYVDLLILETCQDTRNVKAALLGIDEAFREIGFRLPVIISGTIEPMGTMLAGQNAEALVVSLEHVDALGIGLNCATGPEFMTDHLRTIHETAAPMVSCYPNAGLPDEDGNYGETPESLAGVLERFARNGWLNIVGGCCGTTHEHIQAIAQMAESYAPRRYCPPKRTRFSGIDVAEVADDNRPLLVGERTNVVGSRRFKRLIDRGKYEQAAEIARAQVKGGAHIIDINLENPDRDELADIGALYDLITRKVRAPIMIDSTSPSAVERALTYCQGKAIVNSINFEDGEERFDRVVPLLLRYGAAVVVGTIDEDPEQAQAITRERKLAITERSHALLTGRWNYPEENIVVDPLVFPCGTGDANYVGSAVETTEALRLIKERLPNVKTILGISNVSFGLPPAAREVVNAVFLHQATRAGLDIAIVNTERLRRYASLSAQERELAEGLLYNLPCGSIEAPSDYREQSDEDRVAINHLHIARITDHFRGKGGRQRTSTAQMPLDERLANYIVEGTKEGLFADLERKLGAGVAPLDIVNGPLMAGMKEVGRLFNDNQLIVAEVLQSAESMKAAVDYLEPRMEKSAAARRGRVVLATVKGDVHDIGKNLVDIIFSNNGYDIVNLGIKVAPEALVKAAREYTPDVIGLSGLLVKSAQQMVVTAEDLRHAGVEVPLIVGGAALSAGFTRKRIAPAYRGLTCYARDAMSGLSLLDRIMEPDERPALAAEHAPISAASAESGRTGRSPNSKRSTRARLDVPPLQCPYAARRQVDVPHLRDLWRYVNPAMLYSHHLGFRGNFQKAVASRVEKALSLKAAVEELMAEAEGFMVVRSVWRFLEAEAHGNAIRLYQPSEGTLLHEFTFPRQRRADGLCLADFVARPNGYRDSLALMCVTAGEGIRQRAEALKDAGEYFKAHALQVLAIETAEACAEWLHRRIREDWGFADPEGMPMADRFRSRYRGRRYSFGYAACPDLENQQALFDLLRPEGIGVNLTEAFMMEPEASVSALVFQHPDCVYFDVNS